MGRGRGNLEVSDITREGFDAFIDAPLPPPRFREDWDAYLLTVELYEGESDRQWLQELRATSDLKKKWPELDGIKIQEINEEMDRVILRVYAFDFNSAIEISLERLNELDLATARIEGIDFVREALDFDSLPDFLP
jgi:hypothetical protein